MTSHQDHTSETESSESSEKVLADNRSEETVLGCADVETRKRISSGTSYHDLINLCTFDTADGTTELTIKVITVETVLEAISLASLVG